MVELVGASPATGFDAFNQRNPASALAVAQKNQPVRIESELPTSK